MASKRRRYVPKAEDCCPEGPLRGLERATLIFEGGIRYTVTYSPEGQMWWGFRGIDTVNIAASTTFENICSYCQSDWAQESELRTVRRKRSRARKRRAAK